MVQGKNSPPSPNPAEIYEQFYIPAMVRHWTPFLLEFACPKPGEHILDLACGTGIVGRNAARYVGPQARIVGLDINPAMLEVAKQRVNPEASFIEWKEGNAEQISFPDQTFDLVLCQAGFMLFKNKASAASEMYRVLRPGGRAVVMVWQSLDRHPFEQALYESISRRMGVDIATNAPRFSLGGVKELTSLLSEAGFSKVSVFPIQYYTFVDEPDRYLDMTIRTATAAIQVYATLDDNARSELIEGVNRDLEPVKAQYIHRGRMIYPAAANIAVASA